MAEFVINDQARINSHGFRLMNVGARLARYNDNPVVLYNHEDDKPIGVGQNLHIEGERMIFSPDFDMDDPLALSVSRKVEKGHLKGCSPGLIVYAAELVALADGTDELRVTDWELCELSIVSVPSNAGALKMYNAEMQELTTSDLTRLYATPKPKNKMEVTKTITLTMEAAGALGLSAVEVKDGQELSAAIMELTAQRDKLAKQVEEQSKAQAEALVDLAVQDGRIAATLKDKYVQMAMADYELAKETLEGIKPYQPLSKKISGSGTASGIPAERQNWPYWRWLKEDKLGLDKLREDDPEAYKALRGE